jgi:predicted HTH transcriptional regulator
VRGVPDVLRAEERLVNIIAEGIRRLVPDIEIIPWRKVNVLAVQVYPSQTRPHSVERLGPVCVFLRAGSTCRRAEESQIEELERLRRMDSFDEQALPDLNSEAGFRPPGSPGPTAP